MAVYIVTSVAKEISKPVSDALTARLNTNLLFPVYDVIVGSGANATYHVVGWVGFHLTGFGASAPAEA